ncbi:hypothetical protein D9619_000127 [Psilocybe cf. subviscida]|uniref:Uncharacterized protein n=1 Tax=Psilocybe cf. subviscida TaxID=2480587 RepID=A0A8H5BF93_9AGAR|nr:hypothetical protein D9619_000127 [Psilocybe cf. subviscida]
MQIFTQALSALATVLLLLELSVFALAVPIDTQRENTADSKSPSGHEGPHGISPDIFLLYNMRRSSTEPTSNLDEPQPKHLVDDVFNRYGREYNQKGSNLDDTRPDAEHGWGLVDREPF